MVEFDPALLTPTPACSSLGAAQKRAHCALESHSFTAGRSDMGIRTACHVPKIDTVTERARDPDHEWEESSAMYPARTVTRGLPGSRGRKWSDARQNASSKSASDEERPT
jgi:hypothetical protein